MALKPTYSTKILRFLLGKNNVTYHRDMTAHPTLFYIKIPEKSLQNSYNIGLILLNLIWEKNALLLPHFSGPHKALHPAADTNGGHESSVEGIVRLRAFLYLFQFAQSIASYHTMLI